MLELAYFRWRDVRFRGKIRRTPVARFNLHDDQSAAGFTDEIKLSPALARPPVGFDEPVPFGAQKRRGEFFAAAAEQLLLGLGHGS